MAILSAAPISAAESAVPSPGKEIIIPNVPFTAQAPLGNWRDRRQQDGCEETASLMAVTWARGQKTLAKAEAERHVLAIAGYEKKFYGSFTDTSAGDTLKRIINGYFKFSAAGLKTKAGIADLKKALGEGAVVIIPTDGRKLKNPYFTQPGPERHNLLLIGYDGRKKEFIANDPGTRRGAGYRYGEKIIEAAWRDYPTGDHLPIKGLEKNMIIVRREKSTAIDRK